MDYAINFIGIILIVTAGTSPGVDQTTAFVPISVEDHTFCKGTVFGEVRVEKHEVFLRVNKLQIVRETDRPKPPVSTDWPQAEVARCEGVEDCMLFKIAEPSELTIDSSQPGPVEMTSTYCELPRLGDARANVQLIADPRSKSMVAFILPAGELHTVLSRERAASSVLHVAVPPNQGSKNIVFRASPRGGGKPRTLVVKPGSTITLLNVPSAHAVMDLNHEFPQPSRHSKHFFLFNELLPSDRQICSLPPNPRKPCLQRLPPNCPLHVDNCAAFDGDPACSNNGCCP